MIKKKKKAVTAILIVLTIALLFFFFFYFTRLHNGINILYSTKFKIREIITSVIN